MKRLLICTGLLFATALFAQPATQPGRQSHGNHRRQNHHHRLLLASAAGPCRPYLQQGRPIQQTHQSYPVWRAGANAATTMHTDADISLGNLNVPAGTYTLFVDIADPTQWTLVVSKETGEWGLAYNKDMDLGRVKMAMSKPPSMVEDLVYTITDRGGNRGMLTLAWENEKASVPIRVH